MEEDQGTGAVMGNVSNGLSYRFPSVIYTNYSGGTTEVKQNFKTYDPQFQV